MMSARLSKALIMKPYSISGAVRSLTVPHAQKDGRRVKGENNTQKHYYPTSAPPDPSPVHPEFDPKRTFKFPVDPKSNTSDRAPQETTSSDYNRSGSRTTEYSNVDKKDPYSPPGGQHRYGGTKGYEWNAERIEKESKKGGGDA